MQRSVTIGVGLSLLLVGGLCGIVAAEPVPRESAATDSATVGPVESVAASDATAQERTIRTEHFEITYAEGERAEAKEVASYADEYYELLFQRFGVAPPEGRVTVEVVADETVECDGFQRAGCFEGIGGKVVVTSADRQTFLHELTHWYQNTAFGLAPGAITPEVAVEGTAHHITTPPEEIARSAAFERDAIYFTDENADGDEYDELALFPEYVLHEYGREGYDLLFTEGHPRALESITDEAYPEIIDAFYSQLDEQRDRMRDGGASAPGFTYDPFVVEAGETVTFDARTPDAIEAIGRTWYNGQVDSYEWDFDGDGEIEATGPTVSRTIDDPADKTVTLYVTIDGERHAVEQTLLPAVTPEYEVRSVQRGPGTFEYDGSGSWGDLAAVSGGTLSVDVTVGNDGEIDGTETAELVFRDEVVATETVAVASGGTSTVTLSAALPEDIGSGEHNYRVRVGEERTREKPVYVVESVTADLGARNGGLTVESSLLRGTTTEVTETAVSTGTETTVHVPMEITDPYGVSLPTTVELFLDGESVGERETTLSSNSDSVAFDISVPDEPGEYELRATLSDERDLLDGQTEATHTLVVTEETRLDQSIAVRCGSELRDYCPVIVESVDAPETVPVGTEAELDIGVRLKNDHSEVRRLGVQAGIDDRDERVVANVSADGTGQLAVTETFEETGQHTVTIQDLPVHTFSVVERSELSPEASDGREADADTGTDDRPRTADDDSQNSTEDIDSTGSASDTGASGAGFGVTAGALSILLLGLALRRSR